MRPPARFAHPVRPDRPPIINRFTTRPSLPSIRRERERAASSHSPPPPRLPSSGCRALACHPAPTRRAPQQRGCSPRVHYSSAAPRDRVRVSGAVAAAAGSHLLSLNKRFLACFVGERRGGSRDAAARSWVRSGGPAPRI
jgi:hypothetical protein